MDRKTQIARELRELTTPAVWEDINRIRGAYAQNQDGLEQSFLASLERLFVRAGQAQAKGQKGAAAYLLITYLRSSFAARTYAFNIALYDEKLYADANCMGFYWTPEFIFARADAILAEAAPKLRRKVIRLTDAEIEECRPAFFEPYLQIARYFFSRATVRADTLPGFTALGRGAFFQIAYGEYMGPAQKIKRIETGGNEPCGIL